MTTNTQRVLELLNRHYAGFRAISPMAHDTGHTVPSDTKSWSEILISLLTGLRGRSRKKGSDLEDGSDVKAANVWQAIDTPRFNGVLPAGRTSSAAARPESVQALDGIPYIFFVLWDHTATSNRPRCRVWVVQPPSDGEFRAMAKRWYDDKALGIIRSNNFQLHPPRNQNSNVIRNSYGNLKYPLLFSATHQPDVGYRIDFLAESIESLGPCEPTP